MKLSYRSIKFPYKRIRIGLRTIKTAAAVTIAMGIIAAFGLSASKMMFAMLGAMAAMENTFKESLENCITQIVGMIFGAILGIGLMQCPFHPVINCGIGIVLIITFYNVFRIHYSPTICCIMIVSLCTTPDIMALDYVIGRIWATSVGLLTGMLINTLVFPYDNSQKIRTTVDFLDKELIRFLEDMFDGNSHLPDMDKMSRMIDDMRHQLKMFSEQSFWWHRGRKISQLKAFETLMGKERLLGNHMAVLCRMTYAGRLNDENRALLKECGAHIKDNRVMTEMTELDVVTNYHVKQLLLLRKELLDVLKEERGEKDDRKESQKEKEFITEHSKDEKESCEGSREEGQEK